MCRIREELSSPSPALGPEFKGYIPVITSHNGANPVSEMRICLCQRKQTGWRIHNSFDQSANGGGRFLDDLPIKLHILSGHSSRREMSFKELPASPSVDLRNPVHRCDCLCDVLDQKTSLSIFNQFRHRPKRISDDRGATGHSLNQNQAEGFRPINGKKQSGRLAQELLLLVLPNLADKFN